MTGSGNDTPLGAIHVHAKQMASFVVPGMGDLPFVGKCFCPLKAIPSPWSLIGCSLLIAPAQILPPELGHGACFRPGPAPGVCAGPACDGEACVECALGVPHPLYVYDHLTQNLSAQGTWGD